MTTISNTASTADFEAEIVRDTVVLFAALSESLDGRSPYDGRESPALVQARLCRGLASLTLAMTRLRAAHEAEGRTELRAIRSAEFQKIARASHERMADRITEFQKNARVSDERIPAGAAGAEPQPAGRKRGAQPGNANALKDGRQSREAKARRHAIRAALGRARELAREAQRLVSARRDASRGLTGKTSAAGPKPPAAAADPSRSSGTFPGDGLDSR